MYLMIVAVALFLNPVTNQTIEQQYVADDLADCVATINNSREPQIIPDGEYAGTWYMVKSECLVVNAYSKPGVTDVPKSEPAAEGYDRVA